MGLALVERVCVGEGYKEFKLNEAMTHRRRVEGRVA